jgi:hypothetical protein
MKIIIEYTYDSVAHTTTLDIACSLDSAKRLADDLYFMCPLVRQVRIIGDSDNVLFKTI